MPKQDLGLHKDISSIFNGASVQQENPQQNSSESVSPEQKIIDRKSRLVPSHLTTEPKVHHASGGREGSPEPAEKQPEPSEKQAKPIEKKVRPPDRQPTKRPKIDIAAKKTSQPSVWTKTCKQIQEKLFSPRPGVSQTKQKVMTVLIPALFVVLIVVLTQVMKGPAREINKTTESAGSVAFASTAGTEIDWQIPEPYPATLRDPMQFGSTGSVHPENNGKIIVKGILYTEARPAAIIDNEIVYQGDQILGATVLKINKDSVEFEKDGKTWVQKVQR